MKTQNVTVGSFQNIEISLPDSLSELITLASPDDASKGEGIVLNAANEYFKQTALLKIRNLAIEMLSQEFDVSPTIKVGNIEVEATLDEDGKIDGYKSKNSSKTYKKDAKITTETGVAFIKRLTEEFPDRIDDIKNTIQQAATETEFDATPKRVKGSVASKPVGKKWLEMAEKFDKAGNLEQVAVMLLDEVGIVVDVSGADKVKRIAIALAERERRIKAEADKGLSSLGETKEAETEEE